MAVKKRTSAPIKKRASSPQLRSARGAENSQQFPIVAIGASAGGLEAITQLLEHLPAETGMAYVLVQHLAPQHESALVELLSKQTRMVVREVVNRMEIEPNHVYVIPPNRYMTVIQGRLHLVPRVSSPHMPIDLFFQALAHELRHQAIGVILSGNASDGTLGLRAIKEEGGITFAQDEQSARYDSMPRSAIASGAVDFVLPPHGIAQELARIAADPALARAEATKEEPKAGDGRLLDKLFSLVRLRTGADFSHYKPGTVWRRIQRRMMLRETRRLDDYLQLLNREPTECAALYEDVLIHVTSFFRDPAVFDILKQRVFPSILANCISETPIRLWIAGCSTGEDAYSLMISLLEFLSEAGQGVPIKAFGTDISEKAIAVARRGVYPVTIAAQVSPARLSRFFTRTEEGYLINKSIRDAVVFAKHDVTRDPPYSRLDMVSCRNLLMFLTPAMQNSVFAALHYSLKATGFLVLGSAEGVGEFSDHFSPVDRRLKIFAKRPGTVRLPVDYVTSVPLPPEALSVTNVLEKHVRGGDLTREADRTVLEHYSPPGVIVNDGLQILQFRGHVGPYLDPTPGQATLQLLKIARSDLIVELRAAMQSVRKSDQPLLKEGVKLRSNGQTVTLNLRVLPLRSSAIAKRHFLILFESAPQVPESAGPAAGKAGPAKARQERREIERLERELKDAKEFLRSAAEDQEAVNEELSTANEELLSTNEEFKTSNEELETAKEELQSTNEELSTLNDELDNRNQELARIGNDLRNILTSIFGGVVVVDRNLFIRFLTPQAQKTLNLIPSDIGRSIGDIKPSVNIPELGQLISQTIETRTSRELEASDAGQNWFSVRIQPYVTGRDAVEGALISLVDVTGRKRAEEAVRQGEEEFRALVEGVQDYAIFILDKEGRIKSWNAGAERVTGYEAKEVLGGDCSRFDLPEDRSRSVSARALQIATAHKGVETEGWRMRKDGSQFWANVTLTPLRNPAQQIASFVMFMRDATETKRATDFSQELSVRRISAQDVERERISRELHDTTGSTLTALLAHLSVLGGLQESLDPKAQEALRESVNLAKACAEEIRTLSYQLHPPLLEEAGLHAALEWFVGSVAKLSGLKLSLKLDPELRRLPKEIEVAVFRVIQEAVQNVQRHSKSPDAQIRVNLRSGKVLVEVEDHGKGLPKGVKEGLGLLGMRERVTQFKGKFNVGATGTGTMLTATFPLPPRAVVYGENGSPPKTRRRAKPRLSTRLAAKGSEE